MFAISLGVFVSLWGLFPRLGVLVSALLASLVSAVVFTAIVAGIVSDLPLDEPDVFFARLVAALFQCAIVGALVWAWRQYRT
jgi:hypothetical protein